LEALGGVEQRFIESITYLRKLGFFEDYSDLTSEEIFEKMREESLMLKNLKEEDWINESTFEIDSFIAIHDLKRVWGRDLEFEHIPSLEDEMELLKDLAEISRGIFQPTDMKEWKDDWGCRAIHFTFNDRRYVVGFRYYDDFLDLKYLLSQLNEIINGTGYKYYLIGGGGQYAFLVVLTPEEVKKLMKERGWKLYTY